MKKSFVFFLSCHFHPPPSQWQLYPSLIDIKQCSCPLIRKIIRGLHKRTLSELQYKDSDMKVCHINAMQIH